MMKEKKKTFGLSWIILGLIFFFNPNLHLIDPLPDFIGYIFLCLSFSKMADLNDDVADAVSLFRKMIWVDAGKWLALFLTFSMSASGEQTSSLLLWTFVFAILELIFLIPAYIKLFDGITKLGYFYPNTAILGMVKNKKSATDRAKRATLFFVCMKAFFTVLPELSDLSNVTFDGVDASLGLYRYIGLLRSFAVLVVFILGIIWLCRLQKYFYCLRNDQTLMVSLSEAYATNVRPNVGLFVYRRFKFTFAFLVIALIFSMDYRVDDVTIFPDVLSALAIVLVFISLLRQTDMKKAPWMIASGAYLITSIASYELEQSFFAQYSFDSLIKNDTALLLYSIHTALNLLKTISFVFALALIIVAIRKIITKHTGTILGLEHIDERVLSMEKELHKELCRPLIFSLIASILYGISDLCYDIFAPMLSGIYVEQKTVLGTVTQLENHYGSLKTINLVLLAIVTVLFVRSMLLIATEIKNKYSLE